MKDRPSKEYLIQNCEDVMKRMMKDILRMRPKDVKEYMWVWIGIDLGIDMRRISDYREEMEIEVLTGDSNKEIPPALESTPAVKEEQEEDSMNEEDDEEHHLVLAKLERKKQQRKERNIGRSGVSAEVYGKNNQKEKFVPRVIPKSEAVKERIQRQLQRSFMFMNLEKEEKEIVLDAMDEKKYSSGEVVIQQGDDGDNLYLVDSGKLECSKLFDTWTTPKFLRNYVEGESFGELSLLYNTKRAATIKALEDSVLFTLDRGTFSNIVKEASMKKRERFEEFLSKVELLSGLGSYDRNKICDVLQTEEFEAGKEVIVEGEVGDKFFLIEKGSVQVYKMIGIV